MSYALFFQLNVVSKGELRIKNYTQIFYNSEFFYLLIYASIIHKILCISHILHAIGYSFYRAAWNADAVKR